MRLALAVAGDSGHPHDLAGPHLQGHVLDRLPAVMAGHGEAGHGQHRASRLVRGRPAIQVHLPAGHVPGDLGGVGIVGDQIGHRPTVPEHGHPVGQGHHLPELVGDEQDGAPGIAQAPDDLEQLVPFLRGEHGGGLVEDQDPSIPVERLEDLHPLQNTYRQRLDHRLRVNRQAVAFRPAHPPAPHRPPGRSCPSGSAHPETPRCRPRSRPGRAGRPGGPFRVHHGWHRAPR